MLPILVLFCVLHLCDLLFYSFCFITVWWWFSNKSTKKMYTCILPSEQKTKTNTVHTHFNGYKIFFTYIPLNTSNSFALAVVLYPFVCIFNLNRVFVCVFYIAFLLYFFFFISLLLFFFCYCCCYHFLFNWIFYTLYVCVMWYYFLFLLSFIATEYTVKQDDKMLSLQQVCIKVINHFMHVNGCFFLSFFLFFVRFVQLLCFCSYISYPF